ncbi:MAG: ABC transporter permease subunit [Caldilineaceae bacterium]
MKRQLVNRIAIVLISLVAAIVVLPIIFVIGYVVYNGIGALSWEFLTTVPRNGMREGGSCRRWSVLFFLTFGTAIAAFPLAVAAAIYLAEYAGDNRLSRWSSHGHCQPGGDSFDCLWPLWAGCLRVVSGLWDVDHCGLAHTGYPNLAGCHQHGRGSDQCRPPTISHSESKPGATRWQTIRYQVLPHAMPGIITGIILGLGRAAGETAPILFTVAAFYLPELPRSIFDQSMALPYHLYVIATQIPGMPLQVQYGTALVLLLIVLSLTLVATLVRTNMRRRCEW